MGLKYAVGLPTVGEFGDVKTLLELATRAEEHGWDGVHLWDHVLYHQADWPVASSIVAASAIATATAGVRIILTVVLPRRQIQDAAQDLAAIAALSDNRLTVVATIGSMDREYTEFGLDPDPRRRGRALDAALARLGRAFPIWCGARWPNRVGLRRAARHDGAMPTFADQRVHNASVEDFAAAAAIVGPIDIALEGASTTPEDVAPYAKAGMTWWIEALGWWRGGVAAARERIASGPPRATTGA